MEEQNGPREAFERYRSIEDKLIDSKECGVTNDSGCKSSNKDSKVKWNGWGYVDTEIRLNNSGKVEVSGNRYEEMFPAARVLPQLRTWAENEIGISVQHTSHARKNHPTIQPSIINQDFLADLKHSTLVFNFDDLVRIEHSHGHTCNELFQLRHSESLGRVPDIVVWPKCHSDVETVVSLAVKNNVCIIPFGGGTSVTGALQCIESESRMIVSLDMRCMNRLKSIDKDNLIACVEAGMVGLKLHQDLEQRGMTLGHEPDSWEFSTVGGWVATRASGMKKNKYGNIEDMLINLKMVTVLGTVVKSCSVSRASMGPDFTEIVLGSEGTLGVITEVSFRIHRSPKSRMYDSIVFPSFEHGVSALQEIAQKELEPASIRLMDNLQFQLGQSLKPATATPLKSAILDTIKKAYVVRYMGFDPQTLCAATLLFEESDTENKRKHRKIIEIAKKFGGMIGGAENGYRGYFLTYIIAYLRDFAFDYYFLSESFETSVPWSSVLRVCEMLKQGIQETATELGVKKKPLVCFRVTQVYLTGACIYVYFGINYCDVDNPLEVFEKIEELAVKILVSEKCALSHHHGIGKHRQKWLKEVISSPALTALRSVKKSLDPANTFCAGNLSINSSSL